MKTFAMYSFEQWVASVGGQVAAAQMLGVDQTQISRWVNAGAMLSKDGTIFVPSAASYVKCPVQQP
jgi:DNA-binding transcriptional regulator YdaS (Cro superfamily)